MSVAEPQTTNCGFADAFDEIDVGTWVSDPAPATPKPARQAVEQIARQSGFSSREPKAVAELPSKEPEGQINIRAKQSVLDRFREFGRLQEPRWPSGYVLERALEALEREMGQGGRAR